MEGLLSMGPTPSIFSSFLFSFGHAMKYKDSNIKSTNEGYVFNRPGLAGAVL